MSNIAPSTKYKKYFFILLLSPKITNYLVGGLFKLLKTKTRFRKNFFLQPTHLQSISQKEVGIEKKISFYY